MHGTTLPQDPLPQAWTPAPAGPLLSPQALSPSPLAAAQIWLPTPPLCRVPHTSLAWLPPPCRGPPGVAQPRQGCLRVTHAPKYGAAGQVASASQGDPSDVAQHSQPGGRTGHRVQGPRAPDAVTILALRCPCHLSCGSDSVPPGALWTPGSAVDLQGGPEAGRDSALPHR